MRMPSRSVLAAILLASSLEAQAIAPHVTAGTLGPRRIVLETWPDGVDTRVVQGRWFDRAVGVDHAIAGRWRGDTLVLDETNAIVAEDAREQPESRPVRPVATWRLVRRGVSLAGARTARGGGREEVALAPVPRGTGRARAPIDTALVGEGWVAWRGHEAYEWLRTDVALDTTPVARRGAVAWRALRDARTGVAVPMLVAHPDPVRMARANAALDGLRRHAIASAYGCAAELAMRGFEGEATSPAPDTTNVFSYAVAHADARLLTLEVAGSVFCGGAHPSNVWTVTMLDLATGRAVRGTDLVLPSRRGALLRLVRTHSDGRPSSRDVEPGDCPLFVDAEDGRTEPVTELGYAVIDGRFTVVQSDHPHVTAACNGPALTLPRAPLRGIVHPWVLGSLRR